MKTERNTASQFCGTRASGSPEDTPILAEVGKEKPGDRGLPRVSAQGQAGGAPRPTLSRRPRADLAKVKAPTPLSAH